MKLSSFFLFFSLACLAGATLQAQPGAGRNPQMADQTPEERAQQQTERLTTRLELSPEQIAPIKALFLKNAQEMANIRQNTALSQDDKMQLMRENRQTQNEALKDLLTEDQWTRYQELIQQRSGPSAGNRRGGRPRGGGNGQ